MAGNRISRNDPCPCGSGKKFKHCCISKGIDWEARRRLHAKCCPPRGPRAPQRTSSPSTPTASWTPG